MNKVAIRVLYRMLDTLLEQCEELRYHHKGTPTNLELDRALSYLKQAKYILADLFETHD